ncbi:MAG: carotenoid 1,2-hydratase [Proteobacteria bacterium]|nr:MAG: carotenoid 1,2-hydratase [Pseudomonadota bacterium]
MSRKGCVMIDRWRWGWRVSVAVAVVALLAWWLTSRDEPRPVDVGEHENVVNFLTAGDDGRYARVAPGVGLRFPRDHGAHPAFRQEWWYFTGNLKAPDGRRFGFQLTFFRFAHDRFQAYRESAWSHDQSWMSHFAVSDVMAGRILAEQDYARGALDLAGARSRPFAVWVNGWSVRAVPGARSGINARLKARSDAAYIDLVLSETGPPLLQGEDGFSRKDDAGDTASYYYSLPNLSARGELVLGDESWAVDGSVWMDREWSTSVLTKGQSGWDWFAMRLAGGETIMVFQVRNDGGSPFRYAVWVDASGRTRRFGGRDVTMEPMRWWTSARSGSRYPVSWRLDIADAGLSLDIDAAFDAQELDLDFRYWEGVVDVAGTVDNRHTRGEGYMELTGY